MAQAGDSINIFLDFDVFRWKALKNPFKYVVTEKNPSSARLSTFYRYAYNALRGFDDEHEPRTQAWYRIPRRKKAGLLDYVLTIPGQALGSVGVVAGAIVGCLAIDIFFLWLIAELRLKTHPFLTGMLFGYLLGGGGKGMGLAALALGAIGGLATYYLVVYPGLLLVTRVAVPVLSAVLAGFAAPALWAAEQVGLINVAKAAQETQRYLEKERADEQPWVESSSPRAVMIYTTVIQQTAFTNSRPSTPPPPYESKQFAAGQTTRVAQQTQMNNSRDGIVRELRQQAAADPHSSPSSITPTAPPAEPARSPSPSTLFFQTRNNNRSPTHNSAATNTSLSLDNKRI
jgi:hypothetical protein